MSQQTFSRIGVIGAGAWGTALANVAARAGADVVLWTRDPGHADEMARTCENQKRLPGVRLQDNVRPTADPRDLAHMDAVLLVTPAQTVRTMAQMFAPVLRVEAPIAICAKGVERGTLLFSAARFCSWPTCWSKWRPIMPLLPCRAPVSRMTWPPACRPPSQ